MTAEGVFQNGVREILKGGHRVSKKSGAQARNTVGTDRA